MPRDAENSTPEEVISNLGLMDDGVPCNGALLLFGKHPQRRFVTSSFKIGRFGSTNYDLLSQEIVDGNLIQMPDRVMRTLSDKYLIRPIHYEGLQRVEPLELPEDALREIICNSIVHRDHQGTWTQMSIYNDHIRLWNEGKLPEDLSIEKLMGKHTSKPRNPKMAEAFYRAGFIEAWGRGIEKIVNGFKADGLTPPTFEIEQGGMTVNIPREKFVEISLNGGVDGEPNQNRTKTELKPNQNRTKKEEKDQIIELIRNDSQITRAELAVQLQLHESSVQRRLDALVKAGRIRHIGPANGGSWQIID
jgi:ATP-dependent DNA helicase RecG